MSALLMSRAYWLSEWNYTTYFLEAPACEPTADLGTCQPPQLCEPIPYNKLYSPILLVLLLWRILIQIYQII